MPRVTDAVRSVAHEIASGATDVARWVRARTSSVVAVLPRDAGVELAGAVGRLRKVRTPRQAVEVFETETERLLTVVMPSLVDHPLPLRNPTAAKVVLASAGGLAAAGEELETIAAFSSAGTAIPHTLPVVIGANLVALAVEVYVAASLRVHALRDAGLEPEPREVAVDVVTAMTGRPAGAGGATRYVTKQMVKAVAARVLFAGVRRSCPWPALRTPVGTLSAPLTRFLRCRSSSRCRAPGGTPLPPMTSSSAYAATSWRPFARVPG